MPRANDTIVASRPGRAMRALPIGTSQSSPLGTGPWLP